MRVWFWFLYLVVLADLPALERERIMASREREHRWEASVDGVLSPLGTDWWAAGLTGRLGYEWSSFWSASAAVPVLWNREPEKGLRHRTGPLNLGTSWKDRLGDTVWNLALGAEIPWEPKRTEDRWYSLEIGAQLAQDPVFLGWSLGSSVNQPRTSSSTQGSLSLQEVVNDTTSWSLAVSPRLDQHRGHSLWSLSVSWRVSWYQSAWGVSTGIGSGTGSPWSWSGSVDHHWDFP